MRNELLHTPEGVRDIYGDECAKKLVLENRLSKRLHMYGYKDIETPSFEFFDIFNKERGSVASKNMFKFFDRDNNTMVLRPDVTPSIARCAAKYYFDEVVPFKLCYNAKTFINNNSYQGRLKETTQIGAELIGDGSVYADAEVLVIVIEMLLDAGLKEFQVELSNVSFFNGIVREAGIDEAYVGELRDLVQEKNYLGVSQLVKSLEFSEEVAKRILKVPQLFGTIEVLETAKKLTSNIEALDAINRLEVIYSILTKYGYENYITFDLGMLGNLDYYTGVTFRAYTYGTGDPIVNGGRYDKLIAQFGKDAAAIGFSVCSDQLLIALDRQKIGVEPGNPATMILYNTAAFDTALGIAKEHRSSGMNVNFIMKEENRDVDKYISYCAKNNIGGILYVKNSEELDIINASTKEVKTVKVSELMQ